MYVSGVAQHAESGAGEQEHQIVSQTGMAFAVRGRNCFRHENISSEDHFTRWSTCLHAGSSQRAAYTSSQRESSL